MDVAHECPRCRTLSIYSDDATYPRRCGACGAIVRAQPPAELRESRVVRAQRRIVTEDVA